MGLLPLLSSPSAPFPTWIPLYLNGLYWQLTAGWWVKKPIYCLVFTAYCWSIDWCPYSFGLLSAGQIHFGESKLGKMEWASALLFHFWLLLKSQGMPHLSRIPFSIMIKTAILSEKQTGPMSVFRGLALLGNNPLSAFPVAACADFKLGWIKVIQNTVHNSSRDQWGGTEVWERHSFFSTWQVLHHGQDQIARAVWHGQEEVCSIGVKLIAWAFHPGNKYNRIYINVFVCNCPSCKYRKGQFRKRSQTILTHSNSE